MTNKRTKQTNIKYEPRPLSITLCKRLKIICTVLFIMKYDLKGYKANGTMNKKIMEQKNFS
jgi:hypothetical protein